MDRMRDFFLKLGILLVPTANNSYGVLTIHASVRCEFEYYRNYSIIVVSSLYKEDAKAISSNISSVEKKGF